MFDIWDNSQYSREHYIGRLVTDADIAAAEEQLGYRLPDAYKNLVKEQNGGILKKNVVSFDETEEYYVEGLYGIDPKVENSMLSEQFGTRFWIEEWEYPEVGVVLADTPSAGHDLFFLDYSKCGKDGEPSVVLIDQEFDFARTPIADSFEEFLNMLHD